MLSNLPVEEAGRVVFGGDEGFGAGAAMFEDELVELGIDCDGILLVEACHAEFIFGTARGADHAGLVEVAKRVGLEIVGDFLEGKLIRDEVLGIGEVDAVMAGESVRRTTDADMDFLGAGVAEVHDAGAGGRSAHNGIVDDDDAFACDAFLDDVEFDPDAEFAREL